MRGKKLSYNPLTNVVKELKEKMVRLMPEQKTLIAVVSNLVEVKYIDPELEKERLNYIKDYVSSNFSLIEINQYSLPLSGILLGFFKISNKTMLVLYSETGKIGNFLAYRGIINTYTKKIDECIDLLQKIYENESIAYDVIRLKKVEPFEAIPASSIEMSEKLTSVPSETLPPSSVFPALVPKYAKKKFAFKEGLILQFADGKNSIKDIIEKSNFSGQEVEEIIEKYEKKGWLQKIYKK